MPADTPLETQVDHRLPGLPIDLATTRRESPEGMVVLMPSARDGRTPRTGPRFARWTWVDSWPDAEVLAFEDPVLMATPAVNGAWYVHPDHDVVATIATIVGERAIAAGVPHERIVFYGSSLGGFGALACAAHLPGARAVAEIPQIEVGNWMPGAVAKIEQHIIGGPLDAYPRREQISLRARFEYAERVPEFTIITNDSEYSLADQQALVEWCHGSGLPGAGPQRLEMVPDVKGHGFLPRERAITYVQP